MLPLFHNGKLITTWTFIKKLNLLSSWTNYVVLTELFSFVIFLYSPLIALKYESVKLILY